MPQDFRVLRIVNMSTENAAFFACRFVQPAAKDDPEERPQHRLVFFMLDTIDNSSHERLPRTPPGHTPPDCWLRGRGGAEEEVAAPTVGEQRTQLRGAHAVEHVVALFPLRREGESQETDQNTDPMGRVLSASEGRSAAHLRVRPLPPRARALQPSRGPLPVRSGGQEVLARRSPTHARVDDAAEVRPVVSHGTHPAPHVHRAAPQRSREHRIRSPIRR